MTKQTADKIRSHWQFLVMLATIFVAGWMVREALSSEISQEVKRVEQRVNERLATMQQDVRDIRNFLIGGKVQPPVVPP